MGALAGRCPDRIWLLPHRHADPAARRRLFHLHLGPVERRQRLGGDDIAGLADRLQAAFGDDGDARSLIAATNASVFFPLFFLPCFAAFFCSTAPQAFFRPDRRFRTPARAEAVKVGRRSAIEAYSDLSRPRLDSFEHGGRLDDHGPEERSVVELNPFRSRGLMSLPDPPFSTRSRGAGRNMASGFRCRYVPNALKRRSVHEESRGHRGPSRQGQHSAARCGEGNSINLRRLERQPQHSIGTSCR